jgi:prepilin-type N-terminal cleavage/methylation domain-containing protein
MTRSNQTGFTLIEIAIVLVIIGLLLGGVLKGQELITSARVRNLIAQQDGIKAAFFGFQDRFRAYPGDYASASTTLKCPTGSSCLNGNGNGIVEAVAAPQAGSEPAEAMLAWMHLASAGFLNGSYTMATGTVYATGKTDANTPKNPYNIYLELIYDNVYADTAAAPPNKHNLKTGAQVPVEIISEVDRKIDDGNGLRGGFRYSQYQGNAPAAPPAPAAAYAATQCVSTTGNWYIPEGEVNCGGASLF